jgi:hypothetical protein
MPVLSEADGSPGNVAIRDGDVERVGDELSRGGAEGYEIGAFSERESCRRWVEVTAHQ